jgi:hypothetical protein
MQPISFGERIATAFVSLIATAITLFAVPLIFSAIAHNGKPLLMYGWIFSKLGILTLFLSAIAGFSLGADRMANVFSFFWGTHLIWEEEWFLRLTGVIVLLFVIILFTYFIKK